MPDAMLLAYSSLCWSICFWGSASGPVRVLCGRPRRAGVRDSRHRRAGTRFPYSSWRGRPASARLIGRVLPGAMMGAAARASGRRRYANLTAPDSSASLMWCMLVWSWRRMARRARGATSQARPLGWSFRKAVYRAPGTAPVTVPRNRMPCPCRGVGLPAARAIERHHLDGGESAVSPSGAIAGADPDGSVSELLDVLDLWVPLQLTAQVAAELEDVLR